MYSPIVDFKYCIYGMWDYLLCRPYDSRILMALGDTYHSLDKNEEAKKVNTG